MNNLTHMSNEKPIHHFKSMVPADLTEPWKRPLGLDCDSEGCPGYGVWARQGSEPQPRFLHFTTVHVCLLMEEGVNIKTDINERGKIVTQPCSLDICPI